MVAPAKWSVISIPTVPFSAKKFDARIIAAMSHPQVAAVSHPAPFPDVSNRAAVVLDIYSI